MPAMPDPSWSTLKLGCLAKSTKYSVTSTAFSPPKSAPSSSCVPSPNKVQPLPK